MAKVDLGQNVQLFGQDNEDYCGEANAKMARNGYPDPGNRVPYDQKYLYNIIEAKNTTLPGDKCKWGTDPQGLSECLQSLSAPPVNWVVFKKPDRDLGQRFIMDCIEKAGFPVPVLIQEGRHWVLVVGWETKVPPGGGSPVLSKVNVYNPEPVGEGHKCWVTARKWNSAAYFSKVSGGQAWDQQYVAVGQGA